MTTQHLRMFFSKPTKLSTSILSLPKWRVTFCIYLGKVARIIDALLNVMVKALIVFTEHHGLCFIMDKTCAITQVKMVLNKGACPYL